MSNWYGAFSLFRREVTRFRKILIDTTVSPVVSNLLYLIIFSIALSGREVMGTNYLTFLAPGLITMTIISSSFSNPAFAIVISKFAGTINDILISPLNGIQIVLAYVGAAMVRAMVTGTLTFIAVLLFAKFTVHNPLLAILAALLTSMFFGVVGVILGYFGKQFENLTMMLTFIITPMSFLGGVFYSVNSLPEPWKTISLFNPMFYFIDLFRYACINVSHVSPIKSFTVAIFANIVIFPVAIFLYTKGKRLTNL